MQAWRWKTATSVCLLLSASPSLIWHMQQKYIIHPPSEISIARLDHVKACFGSRHCWLRALIAAVHTDMGTMLASLYLRNDGKGIQSKHVHPGPWGCSKGCANRLLNNNSSNSVHLSASTSWTNFAKDVKQFSHKEHLSLLKDLAICCLERKQDAVAQIEIIVVAGL